MCHGEYVGREGEVGIGDVVSVCVLEREEEWLVEIEYMYVYIYNVPLSKCLNFDKD